MNWVARHSGVILGVLTVVIGTVGYSNCDEVAGWIEPLYKSLQHFALSYEDKCSPLDHPSLNVARFMAAILLVFAIVRLLFSHIWSGLKLRTQALFRKNTRHILIGYGAVNQEIARERVGEGYPVTIVARSFDAAAQKFAATHRVVLIERDVRDEAALNELFLHRARRIIIACGEDSLTINTAQMVSALVRKKNKSVRSEDVVYAHFTNTEVHRQLQLTSDAGLEIERNFSGFSIREETARHLFSRTWLAERASRHKPEDGSQPRLHVAIVGGGDLGMAMAREALVHGCSANLGPPLVTVFDREKDGGAARFKASMGNATSKTIPKADRPEINFKECLAEAVNDELKSSSVPVTAWIICCRDDATNLELAMRLEGEMKRGLRPPAPIFPRQWQGSVRGTGPALERIGQQDPWHLVAPFGGMQDVVPTLSVLDEDWLKLPKSIHEQYKVSVDENFKNAGLLEIKKQYGAPPWADDEGPQDPVERAAALSGFERESKRLKDEWPDLPDEGRLSNIASAQQAAVRLWELGYDWKYRYTGALPQVNQAEMAKKFNAPNARDLGPDTKIGKVCAAEHRRWMIERALRGWSAARTGQRSNALRLHPDFRPYGDLYDDANEDAADPKTAIKDANLRRLDAATLRGITTALAQTGSGNKAILAKDPEPVSILDVPELYPHSNAYRLIVTVPQFDYGDEDIASKLAPNLERLVAWSEFENSFSIRFRPDTPDVWTNDSLNDCLRDLHHQVTQKGIHIFVDHPDATIYRNAIKADEET